MKLNIKPMKKILFLFVFLNLIGCNTGQEASPEDINYLKEEPTLEKIVVYQMMTRLFGNKMTANKKNGTKNENGVGKFEDINDKALAALKDLGVTHVWYTGVIEHAQMADYTEFGIPMDDADVIKGRAGSPYAIKDYYDVDPDLAENPDLRMEEFEALIQRTHDMGLRVIIDFVPNHVARFYRSDMKPNGIKDFGEEDDTSVLFAPSNNFYYMQGESFEVPQEYNPLGEYTFPTKDGKFTENPAKATGNNVFTGSPSINDWFETAKLNYGIEYGEEEIKHFSPVPATWQKMRNLLTYWSNKGVDGFRCDMAEMVPVEFWAWLIPQVKQTRPQIQFIAEIYTPSSYKKYLDEGQFDILYDKVQLYDSLKHIIQQKGSTYNLPQIWRSQRGMNKNLLRFLENHDEQRIASADFAGNASKAIPAMVVTATLYTGPTMIYFGQEVGEPGQGDEGFGGEDGRTTIFDYCGVPKHQQWMNNGAFDGGQLDAPSKELREFYKELLNFTTKNEAVAKGALYDLQETNEFTRGYSNKVYSYLRFTKNQCLLVVTNFSDTQKASFNLEIPDNAFALAGIKKSKAQLTTVFGTKEAASFSEEGVNIKIASLGAHIYEISHKK